MLSFPFSIIPPLPLAPSPPLRIGALLALGLVLPGCDPPPPNPAPPVARRGFIAVVGAGQDDPFWPVLSGSALRCRPGLGELELRAAAPDNVSVNAQAQLIRQLQSEGLRGLCIQVIDPAGTEALLRRLSNEGVVVVTLMNPVSGSEPYFHCGVDQTRLGESMADLVAEVLDEKGTLAVLHADSALPHTLERHQAFSNRVRSYARLSVLREIDCGGDPSNAREIVKQCMERYPRLNAWVALDNWPLRGLGDQPLLPPGCKLVTAGPNPAVWDTLADGRCHAMVGAAYDVIMRHAVERCATAIEGKMVRSRTFYADPYPIWSSTLHAYKLDWLAWCATQSRD